MQPELYRDFTLITTHERHRDLNESRFLRPTLTDDIPSLQPRGVYKWIRHLTIEAPLHSHARMATLWGMDVNETSLERCRMIEYMEFLNLHRNVQGVLTRLPHNGLQSFRYVTPAFNEDLGSDPIAGTLAAVCPKESSAHMATSRAASANSPLYPSEYTRATHTQMALRD